MDPEVEEIIMNWHQNIFSSGLRAILFISLFSAASFLPLPAAAQTMPACVDGQYYSPPSSSTVGYSGGLTLTHHFYNYDGSECSASAAQQASRPVLGIARPADAVCGYLNFTFKTCIWIPAMTSIGTAILAMGAGVLSLAGTLFDTLITHLVTDFGNTLTSIGITAAIEAGWTVFRDFSNILIIGFFVFIAVSTILGISEYGAKKLLSRVLIVAVLINFSLLFTRLIIDGSNFTALVIYQQMAKNSGSNSFDIAGSFLKPMGITSIPNDSSLVVKKFTNGEDLGLQSLFFGVVGGILFFAAAVIIFYGCFLIAARGIVLIFLMLTASVAFASYLIPALSGGKYGWSTWWKTLLNSAIFAPFLMLLLAISLAIITAAGNKMPSGGKGLGGVIADPATQLAANGDGWAVIMIYMLGIGMLYLSFKVSSSVAGHVSGMNLATLGFGKTTGYGLNGMAAITGAFSRNLFGKGAAERSLKLDESIKNQSLRLAGLDRGTAEHSNALKELENLRKQKASADKTAKRDFNFMSSSLGKAIAAKAGVTVAKPGGGFIEPRKKAAEEAAKAASDMVLSTVDAQKVAAQKVREQTEKEIASLEATKAPHDAAVSTAQNAAKQEQQTAGLIDQRNTAAADHQRELEEKERISANSARDAAAAPDGATLARIHATRDSLLKAQDERIAQAKEAIEQLDARMDTIADTHLSLAPVKAAQQQLNSIDRQISGLRSAVGAKIVETTKEVKKENLIDAAKVAGHEIHADKVTQKLIDKGVKKNIKTSRLKDVLAATGEAAENAEAGTTPPATTP